MCYYSNTIPDYQYVMRRSTKAGVLQVSYLTLGHSETSQDLNVMSEPLADMCEL